MGGDGGTITNDRRFVRGVKNEDDKNKNVTQQQIMRSKFCAQSNLKLCEPVVACEMGNLYNKEAILTALLDKVLNVRHAHIRGMKDMRTLRLTTNVSSDGDDSTPMFMCPVTGLLLNGIHPFIVIWTTGWVLAEKAIRELGIDALQPEYGPFTIHDLVKLLPGEEEFAVQRTQMETRRETMKAEKKDSKKSKRSTGTGEDRGNEKQEIKKLRTDEASSSSSSNSNSSSSSGATNLTTASSLAKKVMETVQQQEAKSNIFASLFHKGHEADKKDKELFMTVAGLRYSVG